MLNSASNVFQEPYQEPLEAATTFRSYACDLRNIGLHQSWAALVTEEIVSRTRQYAGQANRTVMILAVTTLSYPILDARHYVFTLCRKSVTRNALDIALN